MKLRYIFTAIVSSLCLLVACQQEDPSSLGTIQLEKTVLTIPLEGGSVDLNLVASAPWAFAKSVLINKDPETYAELPAWLTASALSGETGAADARNGRSAETRTRRDVKRAFIGKPLPRRNLDGA